MAGIGACTLGTVNLVDFQQRLTIRSLVDAF